MEPTTAEDWSAVAKERGADAEAIAKDRPTSVGSVYMAGYAIECSLKALLQKHGIPTPTFGAQGHNLHELWRASGLKFSDLKDVAGAQTFFLQYWKTSWRYETSLPLNLGYSANELVAGAKQLNRFIETKISRSRRSS
ncbi:hypothetical protein [[Phormidium] sp. ETS-05]|uniref:hypothetical protein n=1 Tax=[Phormidium] sp. ETS-05 TaxID=222819 RepID=UPI0018EEEAD4|nr:hypothetical protein [[Phormidium] sp. ETS-05]